VKSGIYSLPITLNYRKPDGEAVKENLSASLLVVVPPRLLVNLQSPVPEIANVGEPFPLALDIVNAGDATVKLTLARVEAENADVLEGQEIPLSPLANDEDTSINALVMSMSEGPVEVTVTILYLDDLNREQTIVNSYSSQAMLPPTPEFMPTPETPDQAGGEGDAAPGNLIERLLLGLLGLGS
jgi:hypothetical protein